MLPDLSLMWNGDFVGELVGRSVSALSFFARRVLLAYDALMSIGVKLAW